MPPSSIPYLICIGLLAFPPQALAQQPEEGAEKTPSPAGEVEESSDHDSPHGDSPQDESPQKKSAQDQANESLLFDPEDGMLDASRFLDKVYGFVPIPSLITEPALGGIGGLLGLAFFGERKEDAKVPPNLFVVGGAYTANRSWFTGAGYRGFFDEGRTRARGWAFYGQPNIDLYLQRPRLGEIQTRAEIKAFGGGGRLMRKIGKLPLYLGGMIADKQLNLKFSLVDSPVDLGLPALELDQNQFQVIASSELDTRNNVFSPTDGSYLRLDGGYNMVRGDFPADFGRLYAAAHQFIDLQRVVLGFRSVGNVVLGDAPFYLRPFVALRGVPAARYQGDYTFLLESEELIRITQRIGVNVFGGWGKAMSKDISFKEAENAWNVGAGFRYLLARLYGLQMGVDVARGPEVWAWYVQFGSAWGAD